MSRYETAINLEDGELFIKATMLRRKGDRYEARLMEQYTKDRFLATQQDHYDPEECMAMIGVGPNPDSHKTDALIIKKINDHSSLLVSISTDKDNVNTYMDDVTEWFAEEMKGEMPEQIKDIVNLSAKLTADSAKKSQAGGVL